MKPTSKKKSVPAPEVETDRVPKRLSLNLADAVYAELAGLAKERRSSMTEIVRLALSLVRIAIQESRRGNKLVVTTADGQPLREIVLPFAA